MQGAAWAQIPGFSGVVGQAGRQGAPCHQSVPAGGLDAGNPLGFEAMLTG